jgi:hypothetical protein
VVPRNQAKPKKIKIWKVSRYQNHTSLEVKVVPKKPKIKTEREFPKNVPAAQEQACVRFQFERKWMGQN